MTCPLIRFQQDLVKLLEGWQRDGDRIILFMDANQHIYDGPIGKVLTDTNGLNMKEAILASTGAHIGATTY